MYDRFTDRARKVMQLANQEAQRFNHEYIGTEHVLLGLIGEGSGVAANVLKNLDPDLRTIRHEVEKLVRSGPEMDTRDTLPQVPRVKKVIEYAMEEARTLDHNYVGTEHILLGLLHDTEGVAAKVLLRLGVILEEVREEVLAILGHGIGTAADPLNRHAQSLSESAERELLTQFDSHPMVKEVRDEIDEFNRRKEQAVSDRDFELAASYRDRVDKLKRLRTSLLRVLRDDPNFGRRA